MVRTHRRALNRQQLGADAEQAAFTYLQRRGLQPVARNFRTRRGEIDLIMLDDDHLVFIEVRYRGGGSLVSSLSSVDYRKQQKLASAASMFLAKNRAYACHVCRFDVIGVDASNGDTQVRWIQDAFRPGA